MRHVRRSRPGAERDRTERCPGGAHQAILVGDQRPYITAYIVLSDGARGASTDALVDEDANGFLDDVTHHSLYVRVATDLVALNAELERHERIIVFSLFARRFEPAVFDFESSAQRLAEDQR